MQTITTHQRFNPAAAQRPPPTTRLPLPADGPPDAVPNAVAPLIITAAPAPAPAGRYKAMEDESAVLPLLGDRTGEFFRQAFELKVDGDKLPAAAAQEIIDGLTELLTRFGCPDALTVKSCIKPTAEFHAARHLLLQPEQNLALEQACPIVAVVKTKGRRCSGR